ncbi:antibiotic biosynthesis monooxygenase [Spirillospora sp. NBC_00431]
MSPQNPDDGITFINRFTVHTSPEEFEQEFAKVAAVMAEQPGFIGHTLLKHAEEPGTYVNVAYWASADALRQAASTSDFQRHVRALRELSTTEPAIYKACQRTGGTP